MMEPTGVPARMEIRMPSREQKTDRIAEQIVTLRKLLKTRMADSAGKMTAAFCVLHDRAGYAAVRALDLQNCGQAKLVELVCQKDDRLEAGFRLSRAAHKSSVIIQTIVICEIAEREDSSHNMKTFCFRS